MMLDDPVFWKVVGNNLTYASCTIPFSIAIALLMAMWVNGKLPLRGVVRMAYFTPTILPMIAVANIWLFFYSPTSASLDQITRTSASPPPTGWATPIPCSVASSCWPSGRTPVSS